MVVVSACRYSPAGGALSGEWLVPGGAAVVAVGMAAAGGVAGGGAEPAVALRLGGRVTATAAATATTAAAAPSEGSQARRRGAVRGSGWTLIGLVMWGPSGCRTAERVGRPLAGPGPLGRCASDEAVGEPGQARQCVGDGGGSLQRQVVSAGQPPRLQLVAEQPVCVADRLVPGPVVAWIAVVGGSEQDRRPHGGEQRRRVLGPEAVRQLCLVRRVEPQPDVSAVVVGVVGGHDGQQLGG